MAQEQSIETLTSSSLSDVGLVTIIFGISEFRFLFDPQRGSDSELIEESSTLPADQGGG